MEKIRLNTQSTPLLATVYGKALDSRIDNSILHDTYADDVVRQIDFDFESLRLPKGGSVSLPVRAKHLDGWTRMFIAAHPDATVLHLGCGLDSRVFRIDPPPGVRWFDVDYPEVIALRARLYPPRRDYDLVGASVTDPAWLERVPADRPVLVVAEGLVQYLSEPEGLALFGRIVDRFVHGELIFDAYSRLMVRMIGLLPAARRMRVRLPWSIDDPQELARQIPKLVLVEEVSFLTMPELVARLSHSRVQRVLYRAMGRLRAMKRAVLHLRYRF